MKKNCKILFVNPSLRLGSSTKYLPVGLASVMTFLAENGYNNFDLLDVDIGDLTDEYVESYLASHKYCAVLLGSIVTHYKWMTWFVRTVHKYHPATKVIVGNSVAGSVPELFLRNSGADVAVIGEGELSCLEVLDAWVNNKPIFTIPGIAYIDNSNRFIKTMERKALSKLDDLPMINWDFFDTEAYFQKSYAGAFGLVFKDGEKPRTMPLSSARGCVFRCSFCHFVFWDDPYRYRSPKSIIKEIRRNVEKYNANYISFWDDLSFASLVQVERVVDEILDSGLKFNWSCAIRTDLFGNPKHSYDKRLNIAKKMRESGCVNCGYSLESGNAEILEMMNKKVKKEYFLEQVKILEEAGIASSVSVVFGYPIETEKTIEETFNQCLTAGIYPSIGYLLPLPRTGMYEYALDHGYIVDEHSYLCSITERQDFCLNMTKLSTEKIESLIKFYAGKLNDQLALGLSEGKLLRTGGYMNQRKETSSNLKPLVDTDNFKRNQNDFSFNYSQAVFKIGKDSV
jgi:anaerobic magnesium-protoporphyrin IX monomethyl ester cyclase